MGDEPTAMKPVAAEKDVFAEALSCSTAEARAACLAAACGSDEALRQRVEALLRAADAAGDFLETPPRGLSAKDEPAVMPGAFNEKPGDGIGRYKLLQQIGEGGCGVVYMAEQVEPVRRRVALKVIKLGMDTKSVIARFEAERQALALMDHPNIAKVLDAGATEKGRPYFVMELVRGVKITDYCDQNHLSTEERLKLFTQVCQAIQHAHQKGIIHRDIKPSNILVTQNESVAVPKVIDFGIAKATTDQRLTDKTVFTAFEQFIGTPAYMSPEQAMMTSLDIDTRTDIYALGVLLYELLTGRTPFDVNELMAAGLDGMRRTILEKEPARPSSRLSTMAAADLTTIASNRHCDPAKLDTLLRGDLDWIVMKALEKDRTRRYDTVTGLAVDIHHYLHDEPVSARPVSGPYRLRKFVQRNKVSFAAGAAIAAALLIGALVSTSQAIRAKQAEHEQLKMRRQAEGANRELRTTVSLLELQQAEDLFRANNAPAALAHLAAMLRRDPSNHVAASRVVSALVHRNWALPSAPPIRHSDRVPLVCFSPDGSRVLSAAWDNTARLSDASAGKTLASIRHAGAISAARFNPAGDRFITASADGTARIWDATTGAELVPPLVHKGKVLSAEFSSNGQSVITGCADKRARIWNAVSGQLQREFRASGNDVRFARFSPDGQRVVTGTAKGAVELWDVNSGVRLFILSPQASRLNALCFSADGEKIVAASSDHTAKLWGVRDGQPLGLPLIHVDAVLHAAFSPDSRLVLTTSSDGKARLWNATNGYPVGGPLQHDGAVVYGEFSSNGRILATTGMDNVARLWDVATGQPLGQPLREFELIAQASFSPDGQRLVTGSWDNIVQMWNISQRPFITAEMLHSNRVTSASFDSTGDSVLTTCLDGKARLWNARTGEPIGEPINHKGPVQSGTFSPDGRAVATASTDGTACLWDVKTGQQIAGPVRHLKGIWLLRFSPNGESFVTASADGDARIWSSTTGEPLTPPLHHDNEVTAACFSPNSQLVVTASDDKSARIWSSKTGAPVGQPLIHLDHVEWAEFSPDSEKLVTASADNHARIWDVRTCRQLVAPLLHARTVRKAYFSPDGARVVTCSLDFTARVWDAKTGQALTPPLRHENPVTEVCFSPDGQRILTGCLNGTARVWDANTGQPLTEWLVGGGLLADARFAPGGDYIITAVYPGRVLVWDVRPPVIPVPEWFTRLSESVAGIRLSSRGNVEFVPRAELDAFTQQLSGKEKSDFYTRLGGWFLSDPKGSLPRGF